MYIHTYIYRETYSNTQRRDVGGSHIASIGHPGGVLSCRLHHFPLHRRELRQNAVTHNVCVYICIYTHTYIHIYIYNLPTYIYTCKLTPFPAPPPQFRQNASACTAGQTHEYIHLYVHTLTQSRARARAHTHTHTHTHTHRERGSFPSEPVPARGIEGKSNTPWNMNLNPSLWASRVCARACPFVYVLIRLSEAMSLYVARKRYGPCELV